MLATVLRLSNDLVLLNQVVRDVLGVLDITIAEKAAQVQVDALPEVRGDASQLGQLLQNLISYAIKFHRVSIAPKIHISNRTLAAERLIVNRGREPPFVCINPPDSLPLILD